MKWTKFSARGCLYWMLERKILAILISVRLGNLDITLADDCLGCEIS